MEFEADCIGRDGVIRQYQFLLTEEENKYRINLADNQGSPIWGKIDFQLSPFNNDELRVSDMYIDDVEYREKGIPEVLILNSARLLNKRVVSSCRFCGDEEHLHEPAVKVWERLVEKQLALFDTELGRYKMNGGFENGI